MVMCLVMVKLFGRWIIYILEFVGILARQLGVEWQGCLTLLGLGLPLMVVLGVLWAAEIERRRRSGSRFYFHFS
ncbi:hypothetical protein AAHA92_21340 [Salvia divinorum]|uniref:Uncharacterized protein n=1 Tax=Salvia divinorum TaxID=28513 RepID=A0ABD1GNJ5_SALDI